MKIKEKIKNLVSSKKFEKLIIITILINCFFIGVETYTTNKYISLIQNTCLIIFVLEIMLRFTGSRSAKDYFSNGWNIFDFLIVAVCLVPESLFESTTAISALRVLRVFRILRLLKTNREIQLLVTVLSKSVKTIFYNFVLFLIFMYLFAVVGVTLFKMPEISEMSDKQQIAYIEFNDEFPNSPSFSPDPYYDLGETTFTLFRILTGEDWTDIRYRLIKAIKLGLIDINTVTVTIYHVLWYIISAFLLLNLLIGAILTNYQNEIQKKNLDDGNS